MRPGDAEVSEQRAAISSLLRYRERISGTGTARKAAAVIRDHAIVVGDAGLSQQGKEPIREDAAVNQQHRLPRALHLILHLHTVEIDMLHRLLLCLAGQ